MPILEATLFGVGKPLGAEGSLWQFCIFVRFWVAARKLDQSPRFDAV